jgi:glutamine amidotransferase
MIGIVDYGVGNLGSVYNMLKKVGVKSQIEKDPSKLDSYQGVILPGVGAFDRAMECLEATGFREPLLEYGNNKKMPVLGICLGMQLLFDSSEEGSRSGLGLIPGAAKKFSLPDDFKVPHMGWNRVKSARSSDLFNGIENDMRFYFAHSYFLDCDQDYVLGRADYGGEFTCVVGKENILGCQFHPEKSHRFGMKLLSNFWEHYCEA